MAAKQIAYKEFLEIGKNLGLKDEALRDFVGDNVKEWVAVDKEKKEAEAEAEARKAEAAAKKADEDQKREERLLAREHEIAMQNLRLETERARADAATAAGPPVPAPATGFRMRAPEIPKFDEKSDDTDAYIERFERVAIQQKWEKPEWLFRLSTILTGKALEVYSQMKATDAKDYEKVKAELLKRYQHTEEGYRQRFRESKLDRDENSTQFVARIDRYLDRWITLSKAPKTYEGLVDLLI